jgi:hypothetical protein
MNTFKEFITEKKLPTVGMVKKLIKSQDLDMIVPDFFDVQKKNTDAGMGGYDYIQISFDKDLAKSTKRYSDVKKVIMAISSKFNADTDNVSNGFISIHI